MPWLKAGDNAATHPVAMRVAGLVRAATRKVFERDVAVNEVFGFALRCALQSAGHTTDYVVDEGTALMIGGARTDRLLELAQKAGYLKRARKGGQLVYVLIEDPNFVHIRKRAELDWEAQQREDASNTALTVPVRLRDGDACRYCAQVVNWGDRRGGRGGTYDHRHAGQAATPDTLVVACRSCNSGRRDRDDADTRYPLKPAPVEPYYSERSAAFLAEHGHHVTPTADLRPGTRPDTAPATRHPDGSRTTATRPTADNAPPQRKREHRSSAEPADRLAEKAGSAGTGRDGTGSARSAGTGDGAARARRSRRGNTTRSQNREA